MLEFSLEHSCKTKLQRNNIMLAILGVISTLVVIGLAGSANVTKEKRGITEEAGPSYYNLDFLNPGLTYHQGAQPWNQPLTVLSAPPLWNEPVDFTLGQVQLQAVHNLALQALTDHNRPSGTPSIAYSSEVLRAIQYAKEANRHVQIAQRRVAEAKRAAVVQQRIALTQEAAAREAAQRSAEIAANAEAEARSSARQLVALQQRLATLKDALASAQRVAAARENAAAAAIQRSAQDTAAELKKQDVDRQISQSEREARVTDKVASRENVIAHGVHNSPLQKPNQTLQNPWG